MAIRTYNLQHLDQASSMFFERELETIMKENFDVKRPPLMAAKLLPLSNEGLVTDERVTLRQFDYTGRAKRMRDMGEDLPTANATGAEISYALCSYGASFTYSLDELGAGAREGRPLDRKRAEAARKIIDLKIDDVLADGDSDAGLEGLLGTTNRNSYTLASDGTGASKAFSTKTPDQMIRDVNAFLSKVRTDSKGVHKVNRCVFPISVMERLQNTPRSDVSDTTVLTFLKATHPGVEFLDWERLADAGAAGVDRMIAYEVSPTNMFGLLPIPYEQLAPQLVSFAYKVNCRAKTAGVIVPFPKSFIYSDGCSDLSAGT